MKLLRTNGGGNLPKKELTKDIERALMIETSKWFGCPEVTIGWYGKQRVDFMTMDCKEIFRCFEIKISKADFKSEHGHNFVGHFNYYVIPKDLYENIKDEIPKHIGVYIWNDIDKEHIKEIQNVVDKILKGYISYLADKRVEIDI